MTEIVKVEEGISLKEIATIVSQSGDIYSKNKESHSRALEFASQIIENAKKGVTIEIYNSAKTCLGKLKLTEKSLQDRRKPLTQIMDSLKKEFTKFESELGSKGDVQVKLQGILNDFAAEQEKIRLENLRIAEEKLKTETERNNIPHDFEMHLYSEFANHVFLMKKEFIELLNSPKTIAELDNCKQKITNFCEKYTLFDKIIFSKKYEYLSDEEVKTIIESIDKSKYIAEFEVEYKKEVEVTIKENLDKIETKRAEILESIRIAEEKENADKQRKKEIEEAEAKKKIEDDKRIEQEKEELKKQTELSLKKATVNVSTQKSTSNIKAQAVVQADLFSQVIDVKTTFEYNIEILSNEGWLELFSFWYENIGKSLTAEKIEAYTIKRIREYAEKQAEKEDVFIKSEFLKYNKKIIGK